MITDHQSSFVQAPHFRLMLLLADAKILVILVHTCHACHLLVTLVILVLDKSWNHLHLRLMLLPADAKILGLPSIQSTGTEEELVRGTILIDKTI